MREGSRSAATGSPPAAKVTYKERVSYRGEANEAEWAPIERVSTTLGDGSTVERNVTQTRGVEFMSRPPDLRQEPRREAFSTKASRENATPKASRQDATKKADDGDAVVAARTTIDKMLKAWGDELSPTAWSHWLSLRSVFKSYADEQPNLPTYVTVSCDAQTKYKSLVDRAAGGANASLSRLPSPVDFPPTRPQLR